LIAEDHEDFPRTRLKVASIIRLDKIATISKDLLLGEIGEVGDARVDVEDLSVDG